jgi:integrase
MRAWRSIRPRASGSGRFGDGSPATGSLHVLASKTDAGVRSVDLTPALREELVLWRNESRSTESTNYVLPTSTGRKHNPSNLRRDVLRPAIATANEKLAKDGIAAIGLVSFHGLRCLAPLRRRAIVVAYTAAQLGHTDRFTLSTYAQATKRREGLSGPHLRAYDRAIERALMGTSDVVAPAPVPIEATKNPA